MLNDKIIYYCKELRDVFGDVEASKVLLLKVAVLIYPLLKVVGVKICRPIAIVADSDILLNKIYDELAGFSKELPLAIDLNSKERRKRYEDNDYETFRTVYIGGSKCEQNLSYMNSLCQLERAEKCITFVGFCGGVEPYCLEQMEGVIYMQESSERHTNKNVKRAEFTQAVIHFIEMNQGIIFYHIKEMLANDGQFEVDEQNSAHKLFRCAGCVVELLAQETIVNRDARNEMAYLLECAMEDILNNLDCLHVQDTIWKRKFIDMLYKATMQIPRILNRERIDSGDLDDVGKLPMYDEDYYYLPESLLREICRTWLICMNFSRLRVLLANEGIILTEGKTRKYYTIKTPVITVYGAVKYVRMVKIPRNEVDVFGELTWSEMLLMEEAEDEGNY